MEKSKKGSQKVLAFIQARTTSSRLPNKIYADLNGAPLLFHTIARDKEATLVDDVIVCSPHELDLPDGIKAYVGACDENDVLSRFADCLDWNPCEYVVRLTADCPLLDPHLIDFVVNEGLAANADYAANVIKLTFPDGMDCEMISARTLKFLATTMKQKYNREHVTTAMRDNDKLQEQFSLVSVESSVDYSRMKCSVDTQEDLDHLRRSATEIYG